MNELAPQNHNNPPSPIDEALAPFGDVISEAETWLDGQAVENEGQMKAVDVLIKGTKAALKSVKEAEESESKPIYDQWKNKKAEYAPTITDLDRIVKGLVGIVDGFKRKLAAEKEAARKAAEKAAWEATRKGQEAARAVDATNIEAVRQADEAKRAAEDAQRAAMAAKADTVKGLRNYDVTEVLDPTGYARWLWMNDKEALVEWMTEHARRNKHHVPGIVETRKEKRAQ